MVPPREVPLTPRSVSLRELRAHGALPNGTGRDARLVPRAFLPPFVLVAAHAAHIVPVPDFANEDLAQVMAVVGVEEGTLLVSPISVSSAHEDICRLSAHDNV